MNLTSIKAKLKYRSQKWSGRFSKTFLCSASIFTMVMSPVAQALEAQKVTKAQLESGLAQMGLNKTITMGEFYQKNKALFPDRVLKQIEPLFTKYKNEKMPSFEVTTAKNSAGEEVPSLRFSANGELVNIQVYGNEEKFAKFQNTILSEVDVVNFDDMMNRILAGDEKIRKNFESEASLQENRSGKLNKLVNKPGSAKSEIQPNLSSRDVGYPAIDKEAWKKMSQKERAGYLVNMRLLWDDARRVLREQEKLHPGKSKKSSAQLENLIQKWENFISLINQNAEAAGRAKQQEAPVQATDGTNVAASSNNCVVAGYISSYQGKVCKVETALVNNYIDNNIFNIVKIANADCKTKGSNYIACNPLVYGANPDTGSAYCVNTADRNAFQVATHYDGPCEKQSPLSTAKVDFLKEDLKNKDRYDEKNRSKTDAQIEEEIKNQQANSDLVANFINGLLKLNKKNNPEGIESINFKKEILEDRDIEAILAMRKVFNYEISTAKKSCKAAAANKSNEKNFWGACDQLHRRFLDVASFLKKSPGCKDGATFSDETLKCSCPAPATTGGSGLVVNPGASCKASPPADQGKCPDRMVEKKLEGGDLACECRISPTASFPLDKAKEEAKKCAEASLDDRDPICPKDQSLADDKCTCEGGGVPKLVVSGDDDTEGSGAKVYKCVAASDLGGKPAKEKCDSGFWCKVKNAFSVGFDFLKNNALKIAGGAIALYGLYKLMKPHKPSVKSAGDICPNGAVAPCPATCVSPQALQTNGTCACAACPVGQTITNQATCTCAASSSGSTTTLTCWDNVTKVTSLDQCPPQPVTCWDGSKVANILNCPEKPTTTNAVPAKSKK